MKIAILGAGFTGLTAALKLVQQGHEVTVFEKNSQVGGLASGFKEKDWSWNLDKAYHHLFTNDSFAINLAKEVDQKLITKHPKTAVLVSNQMSAFDSPLALLKFSNLSVINRLRVGFCTFYLKYIGSPKNFENKFALPWLNKFMGKKATDLIWEPLFEGKFGSLKHNVSLTWFWARIKKRTPNLVYPEGGFQAFAEKISQEINKLGGKIYLNTEVSEIKSSKTNSAVIAMVHQTMHQKQSRLDRHASLAMTVQFDKIIVTLPTPIFTQITPNLPKSYIKNLNSIPHLSALNLILFLKQPFFKNNTYWLNITDKSFPFLVLAEHTNFMDPKHYGNQHILYIGNYLPENHPYLKMSPKELFQIYKPYLQKISPLRPKGRKLRLSPKSPLSTQLFSFPNAQPVVTTDYLKLIPEFQSPLKNIYIANMDMVYPWDRGVNYAIELGEEITKVI